jgi:hypothetical protein
MATARRSLNPTSPRPVAVELTLELAEALVAERRKSRLFDEQVGLRYGVEFGTLERWMMLGFAEDAQEPYRTFARAYSDASIELEAEVLEGIGDARTGGGNPDWKADAWWLERWRPGRWGKSVPAAGPREAINVQELLEHREQRTRTIAELFDEPPDELRAAMLEKREEIIAFFDAEKEEPAVTPALPAGAEPTTG